MNRRSFLLSMLKAGVAAMALPAAVTYARNWKRVELLYLPAHVGGRWRFEMKYLLPGTLTPTGLYQAEFVSEACFDSLIFEDIVAPASEELTKRFLCPTAF